MSAKVEFPNIGDKEPCDEYAAFRQGLIRSYSQIIFESPNNELSCGDYVRMYGAAQTLSYMYSMITCCKEIHIPSNATQQALMKFFWALTPPYLECVGFFNNGDPRWRGMHTNNLKEFFYD